jgi:50S ribosomal protein L16 3-hydroxylase
MNDRELLGGRSARAFLARYWQRDALLVRAAMPSFAGLLTLRELVALAARDDVESRLVVREGARYTLEQGPFPRAVARSLPPRNWTLLVQGLNLVSDEADALLRRFAFVPYARLDDVMVSYAAPGGGVGPHFDSYDVFLLQGFGRRRWRYGKQHDLTLRPGLPVKILRNFRPRHDAILSPGDMLYVPPHVAHDGTAIDACTTYSIGFRAAADTELAQHFLDFLRDRVQLPGRYTDRGRKPASNPAHVDDDLVRNAARALAQLRWRTADVGRFLGCFLSEPKPHVTFDRPEPALSRARFAAAIKARGLRLDRRTQWLYDAEAHYVNGEIRQRPRSAGEALVRLADERRLAAAGAKRLPDGIIALLYADYRNGYLHPG